MDIEPLIGVQAFGAVVRGLSRSHLEQESIQTRLRNLWIERGLLVFRETDGTAETQIALSRVFGALERHPNVEAQVDGCPELVHLRYDPDDGDVCEVGGDPRGGYLPWHSDLVYVDRINRGGILRPVALPLAGGETGFIDQIAAYDRLPTELRAAVEGLHVVYRADFFQGNKKFGQRVRTIRMSSIALRIMSRTSEAPRVLHPMVYVQPETQRKVLNVSPWFAVGIAGMENVDGDALLERIVRHCEDTEHAYVHCWRLGDMVLWDNWRMLHSAYGVPPNDRRHMQRTTIAGDYALGRLEFESAQIEDSLRVSI